MSDGSRLLFGAIPGQLKLSAEDKRALRFFARRLSGEVAARRTFTCLIADDRELRRLNRNFLGHDYPTDVLSFPAAHANGNLGEIAISAERASEQAEEFGHSAIDELRILMLHGVLHLTGMDHERDQGEMQRAEDKWRGEFGLPSALIARSSRARKSK
jgi:probable rRNA maturation factor